MQGVGVGALTGEKQGAKTREVIFFQVFGIGVFFFDRAKRGRRGKKRCDIMLRNNPPECARVRCSNRLPLEQNGRVSSE